MNAVTEGPMRMRFRRRLWRTVQAVEDAILRPPFVRSGHYYSPINSSSDVDRALDRGAYLPGIDLREGGQLATFSELVPSFEGVPAIRYHTNDMYGDADAAIYQAFVRRFKPKRVVEVGSGFSTAMLLDTADKFRLDLKVTCVEPYPDRLHALLRSDDTVDIIPSPVQDVPIEVFTSLEAADILFIDSTHVAKAGSDVTHLYLHVLPSLKSGVLVHIHDIFWPFEYPADWLRAGRSWNEAYFLQAFLCENRSWSIELFSSWLWQTHRNLVPAGLRAQNPGAIWLRRL